MKFICPESQKRVSLKWGRLAQGSDIAIGGGLAVSSAMAAGVPPFGRDASGCCACAGIMHIAPTSSPTAATSVLAAESIELRFRIPIFANSPSLQCAVSESRERWPRDSRLNDYY